MTFSRKVESERSDSIISFRVLHDGPHFGLSNFTSLFSLTYSQLCRCLKVYRSALALYLHGIGRLCGKMVWRPLGGNCSTGKWNIRLRKPRNKRTHLCFSFTFFFFLSRINYCCSESWIKVKPTKDAHLLRHQRWQLKLLELYKWVLGGLLHFFLLLQSVKFSNSW